MKYLEQESSTLEFKREIPKNEQIIKTIIGFCNQNGGKLVVGVSDTGEIEGLPPSSLEQALNSIQKAIFEASHPSILPRISFHRFGEKTILEIEVSSGMAKPYYRKSEGQEKGTYIRLGTSTLRATPSIIQELQWQSVGLSFETMPQYRSTQEDLDVVHFEKFLRNRKNRSEIESSEIALQSYGLIVKEHSISYPTMAGLLLFGKRPQQFISEAMIICSHFKGIEGRDTIATIDCEGDLFHQFHQAEDFILSRLSRSFTIKTSKREDVLEIPKIAIREALLNALVHRNYHIIAPIKIAIFENRLEIFSPGGFYGPIAPMKLKAGITYLRNPAICKVFREAGYIEKLGSGLIAIFDSYEKQNLMDPQVIEGENYIKYILSRIEKSIKDKEEAADYKEIILALFQLHPELSLDQVQKALVVSRSTATRYMNALISQGLVVRRGKTKSTRFYLSSHGPSSST